ncbi:MAG: HAD-IA family hydrolase [Chromatiales bacterium]|jgi:phosphoglycolate phosphatase|nr:HAD-IA family hydrolase [Chromatiales bacterium]
MPVSPLRCLLLDLDGTLVDTAPDMAHALNLLRGEHELPPLAYEIIRPHASHGVRMLIRLGFGLLEEDPRFASLRTRFLELYREHLVDASCLFPGMDELLSTIEARDIPWGVVTNKPAWLTEPLLEGLDLTQRAACIVSGDTTPKPKPHPGSLLHAARTVGVPAKACLYVGDASRDIEAGRNAGMRTLVATFGYLRETDQPEEWQADGFVDHPREILAWITKDWTADQTALGLRSKTR